MDPGQDGMSGGLADDMDVVAICENYGVAGPAVGFRCGVEVGCGFDEAAEVSGAVGGDFGQPQAAGRVLVPELNGADDQHFAVVAAPPRGAGGSLLVRKGRLASSISTRPDSGLRSGSTIA